MKPLVIYHADCTDGYGAAFAAWLKLGDEAEYRACQYGSDQHKSLDGFLSYYEVKDREVYVLDFSFPRHIMDMLFEGAKRVVWLDHHKTAFEMWCDKYEKGMKHFETDPDIRNAGKANVIMLDDNRSGAMLAWHFFHPNTEVPMLIQHIDDRDRWQWELDGSAEIHAALSSYKPWTFQQWSNTLHDDAACFELSVQGTAILRAQKQHVERMAKQARKCEISLFSPPPDEDPTIRRTWGIGLAVNASIHQSEVGHELANASGTYGLVYYISSDGRVRCSLRSNGEYDVSAIASSFGGGGHKNASGMEVDVETLLSWLR